MAITTPEKTAVETIPPGNVNGTDIAAVIPVTVPDGPGATAPDTDPTADTDDRVGAVWAALNANPGASATVIGAAADLNRMVAGKILNQLEAEGRARREPGINDGQARGRAADRWYPITTNTTAPDTSAPETQDVDMPGTAPAVRDADAPEADTPEADTPEGDAVRTSDEEALPAAIGPADPAPVAEPTDEEGLIEEAHGRPEGATGDEAPGEGSDRAHGELISVADADASEPVADDPAWALVRAELAELTDLFGGVALAKDEGNAVMALGCLEMAMARVASVHRNARAALTGTAAAPARPTSATRPGTASGGLGGSVRPGALRDRVHAHLIEFPGKEFTPYEIGKVLDASSGAVANALDRLVNLGDAVLSCERPRRFALASTDSPTDDTLAGGPAEPGHTATDGYDG